MPEIGKELVAKFEGSVVESNINEYEKELDNWLAGLKLGKELKTEEEFEQAKEYKQKCTDIETNLHNAKQTALAKMGDVFEQLTIIDRMISKAGRGRIDFDNLGKKFNEKRKGSAINKCIDGIEKSWEEAGMTKYCGFSRSEANEAIKGKRSLDKMNEALEELTKKWNANLETVKATVERNLSRLKEVEQEYPGLFHDKEQLAANDPDMVEAQIESRINDFKLKIIEKKQREEEAEKKAEKETSTPAVIEKPEAPEQKQPEEQPQQSDSFVITLEGDGCTGTITVTRPVDDTKALAKAIHGAISSMGVAVNLTRA